MSSVATVTAGRVNRSERVEVKISDGLQGVRGHRALKRVRQSFEPGSIGALQSSDCIAPTLRATAAINLAARVDIGSRLLVLMAGTKAGLTLGIAQRYFTSGFATSWHHPYPLRNAVQWKWRTGSPDQPTAATPLRGGRPFDGRPGASRLFGGRCRAISLRR